MKKIFARTVAEFVEKVIELHEQGGKYIPNTGFISLGKCLNASFSFAEKTVEVSENPENSEVQMELDFEATEGKVEAEPEQKKPRKNAKDKE